MSYYDLPTANDTMGFYNIFKYVSNDATGGLFMPSMLLVIWIVAFMSIKNYSNSKAFAFASFFCAILSIFLAVLQLINTRYMYLLIVLTMIGFAWLKLDNNG